MASVMPFAFEKTVKHFMSPNAHDEDCHNRPLHTKSMWTTVQNIWRQI